MKLGRAVATSVAVLGVAVGAARADAPRVDVSRCPDFDPAATDRAIAAELAAVPAERAVHLAEIAIDIACVGAITVAITVLPTPTAAPLTSTIDVGDLPAELRLRGVALTVAELVDAALDIAAAAAAAPPPPPPKPTSATAHDEGGVDPAPFAAMRVRAPGDVQIAGVRPPWLARRALLGAAPAAIAGGVRVGARWFLDQPAPLTEVAFAVSRGPLALDLFVATTTTSDELGAVRAVVSGAGISAAGACRGGAGTWLCAGVRGAAGVAVVTTDPVHPMILSSNAVATYFELGPRLELRLEHRRWSGVLAVGLAWSSGLNALAEDRQLVALGGTVVTTSLGVGWGP